MVLVRPGRICITAVLTSLHLAFQHCSPCLLYTSFCIVFLSHLQHPLCSSLYHLRCAVLLYHSMLWLYCSRNSITPVSYTHLDVYKRQACIILAEDAALDEDAKQRADQQGVPVLKSSRHSYELAVALSKCLVWPDMGRFYYDLHLHSALSPCGDNDMTPNNVVNMAKLSGLDLIALSILRYVGCYYGRNCDGSLLLCDD